MPEGSNLLSILFSGGGFVTLLIYILGKYFENRKDKRDKKDEMDKYWTSEVKEDRDKLSEEVKSLRDEYFKVLTVVSTLQAKFDILEEQQKNTLEQNKRLRRERNAARDEAKKWKESFMAMQIKFNDAMKKIEKMKEGI